MSCTEQWPSWSRIASAFTPARRPHVLSVCRKSCHANQYPTNGLGPVISWMGINSGDDPACLPVTASHAISVRHHFKDKVRPDHPMAN